jgi:stearoyl-CoA desaturase (delta-9 desaturase)
MGPGQIDTSARVISWLERLGWVSNVNWPNRAPIAERQVGRW